jgi:hypothetical protein
LRNVLLGSTSANDVIRLLLDTASCRNFVVVSQAGDHVVYSKFAGTDLDVAGAEHVLLKVRTGAGQQSGSANKKVVHDHSRVVPAAAAVGSCCCDSKGI